MIEASSGASQRRPRPDKSSSAPITAPITAPMSMRGWLLAGVGIGLALASAGCASPTATPEPTVTPEPSVTPTVIVRQEPTATPTPTPSTLDAGEVEDLEDVVVPHAAEQIAFEPATETLDARADYSLGDADIDEETLRTWFAENLPDHGWGEPEDRDGALVFEHETAVSRHESDDGEPQPRTLLVLFEVVEGADFSILVE